MVVTTLGHTHHSTTAGFSFSWCLPEICCIFIGTLIKDRVTWFSLTASGRKLRHGFWVLKPEIYLLLDQHFK